MEYEVIEKAARLIYLGLESRKGFSGDREYIELLREFKNDSHFRGSVFSIASGLKLEVLDVDTAGVFLKPVHNSIFTLKKSRIQNIIDRKHDKFVGLILIALAAYYFPTDASFDEESVHATNPITVNQLDAFITEKCKTIQQVQKIENPKEGEELLEALLISYSQLPNEAHPDSRLQSTREYFLRKTLNYLTDERLFIKKSRNEFWPTTKFRYQMEDLAQNTYIKEFLQTKQPNGGD